MLVKTTGFVFVKLLLVRLDEELHKEFLKDNETEGRCSFKRNGNYSRDRSGDGED